MQISNHRYRASGLQSLIRMIGCLKQTEREGEKKRGDVITVFTDLKGCLEGKRSKCSL